MAKLTAKRRKRLRKNQFALPGSRRFPINDKPHARAAKARASEAYHKGRISKSTRDRIFAKANKKLGKSHRRRSK